MPGYYFRLPIIQDLTVPQQGALNAIKPIALSGGPGTGKSVVSLWRHITNYNNGRKSLLLTYTTTLAEYLRACCKDQNINASQNVGTSLRCRGMINRGNYDEIIIDEAQDLDMNFYNDIRVPVSYGADNSQILYPDHSSTLEQLRRKFPNNDDYILGRNFRSTQSIMLFAKRMFRNAFIPQEIIDGLRNNIGDRPSFMISSTEDLQNNAIFRIIDDLSTDTHNIAILVPWKNDVRKYEQLLKSKNYDYSLYYEDLNRFPRGCESIRNVHITTFKSSKGLEFDTVIIPDFEKYCNILGRYKIEWKDYYVACTRAKSNLYLISNKDMPSLNGVIDKINL